MLTSVEDELRTANKSSKQKDRDGWKDTSIVVIQGVSSLFASYLNVLAAHTSFADIWKDLLDHFATMLDVQVLDISDATYTAVRDILRSCTNRGNPPEIGKDSINLVWDLWSRGVPVPSQGNDDENQKCLLAWVETLMELYGLIPGEFDVERIRRLLTLLREAMQHATPGKYSSDHENVTVLQSQILLAIRTLRTEVQGVPSAMITQLAEFVSLAFEQEAQGKAATERRTYVAVSKESMSILQSLIAKHAAERDIYETGAFATALSALVKPITLKYEFKIVTKSPQAWKVATESVLGALEATLPHIRTLRLPRETIQSIWEIIVSLAIGIISADCSIAPTGSDVMEDQDHDVASFRRLRGLIIPSLGAEVIPDQTRKTYAEGLFRTSIIHAPTPAESAIIYGDDHPSNGEAAASPNTLFKPRDGRTIDPVPAKRSRMSEVCLDELFSLVSIYELDSEHEEPATTSTSTTAGHPSPDILVKPSTPLPPPSSSLSSSRTSTAHSPSPSDQMSSTIHSLHARLAETAAPYLILRCALSLRGYVADQPLRGRMPQPLSQRKELYRILRKLVELRSEPEAIPELVNVDSETRKHLLRLYPLLVSAMRVAGSSGDDKVSALVREALDVVGGEFGI